MRERVHADKRVTKQTRSVCVFVCLTLKPTTTTTTTNNKQFDETVFTLAINTRLRHRHARIVDVFFALHLSSFSFPANNSIFLSFCLFYWRKYRKSLSTQVDRATNKQKNKQNQQFTWCESSLSFSLENEHLTLFYFILIDTTVTLESRKAGIL